MKVFLDRFIPPKVGSFLRDTFGFDVIHLEERFNQNEEDEVWLKWAGENGYIVLTCDKRIGRNKNEIAQIRKYKVKYFAFGLDKSSAWERFKCLAKSYDNILKMAEKVNGPFGYKVRACGLTSDKIKNDQKVKI